VFLHFQVASPMNYGNENVFSYAISFFYKLPISSFLVTTLAIMWSQENYLLVTCKKMKLDNKNLSVMWSQCIIWFKKFVLVVFIGQRGYSIKKIKMICLTICAMGAYKWIYK
jgi:hypothetical protein